MTMPVKGVPPTQVFMLEPGALPAAELKLNLFWFHSSMTKISSPIMTMLARTCAVRLPHLHMLIGMIFCSVAMAKVANLSKQMLKQYLWIGVEVEVDNFCRRPVQLARLKSSYNSEVILSLARAERIF
jgi:hypothetical protein